MQDYMEFVRKCRLFKLDLCGKPDPVLCETATKPAIIFFCILCPTLKPVYYNQNSVYAY